MIGKLLYFLVSMGVKGLFKGRSQLFNGPYSLYLIHKDRQSTVSSRVMMHVPSKLAVAGFKWETLLLNKFGKVP